MSILLEDLDSTILSHCDLEDDFINIMMINRYYCKIVNGDKLFLEWKKFYSIKQDINGINYKFQLSCSDGYLLHSKYLLTKYVEININHGYAFTILQ